jgi:hypothetical protein
MSRIDVRIALACLLSLVLPLQFVHADVNIQQSSTSSIQQSSTSNVNGQKISVQTENDKTVIMTGDKTLTIKGDELQYCAQACHEYILHANGTIGEKT